MQVRGLTLCSCIAANPGVFDWIGCRHEVSMDFTIYITDLSGRPHWFDGGDPNGVIRYPKLMLNARK